MFYAWTPSSQPQQALAYHLNDNQGIAGEYKLISIAERNEEEAKAEATEAAEATTQREGAGEADNRRNERERLRVRQVNAAFALLRQHLPVHIGTSETVERKHRASGRRKCSRRTSKVKTLRAAIRYINELTGILQAPENLDQGRFA